MAEERQIWRERKRLWCGLPWTFTVYKLSEDRLFVQSGFLSQREDEVRLYRITDVTHTRSFLQRIFGLGTIHVNSSDKNLGVFDIKNVTKSHEKKEKLSELVEAERVKKRVYTRENMVTEADEEDDVEL